MESDGDTIIPRTSGVDGTTLKKVTVKCEPAWLETLKTESSERSQVQTATRKMSDAPRGLTGTHKMADASWETRRAHKVADQSHRSHGDLSDCSSHGSECSYKGSGLIKEQRREVRAAIRAQWAEAQSELQIIMSALAVKETELEVAMGRMDWRPGWRVGDGVRRDTW
ncbi:UNVERIFIED_CONTAM: hypothetical protein FKN15_033295 [Acipenser sinensis]